MEVTPHQDVRGGSGSGGSSGGTTIISTTNRQPPPPPPLEEKIQAALATLRRDRDKDYRAMVEAQERERHANDELVALETLVEDLTRQHTLLLQENDKVRAQLPSLESHVQGLAEQANFQHHELLAARAKIQQQQADMEAVAVKRATMLEKMRQLAHDRTLQLTHLKQLNEQQCRTTATPSSHTSANSTATTTASPRGDHGHVVGLVVAPTTEALEREINSLLFDWEATPQLIKDKAQMYLNRANELKNGKEDMGALDLLSSSSSRRGGGGGDEGGEIVEEEHDSSSTTTSSTLLAY